MNKITDRSLIVNKKKQYYLDPYFIGKIKSKGDLLQCFTVNNSKISFKDLNIHQDVFYRIRSQATKQIKADKGVPIHKSLLNVFQLKSLPTIIILLKIALHKKLSLGNCKKIYKDFTDTNISEFVLLNRLSQQKALCVQLSGHVLQIVYGKPAGLILENGEPWQPHATDKQLDNLTKAREAKKVKHTFLPVPEDCYDKVATALKDNKEYFDDIDFERKLNIERTRQQEVCASIELKSFGEIYNKGGSNV